MWYAVETVFIDGELFGSKCVFVDGDTSALGHCYASHSEEPGNRCERFFDNRIERHIDWFESEELAKRFCAGEITYVHHYETYYKAALKSTLQRFIKREIVEVGNGILPYRGVYEKHPLNHAPYWCR